MKIVSRKELMELPNGTVYSEYAPCVFTGLSVKVDTWESDWLYDDLLTPVDTNGNDFADKCEMAERGIDVPLDFEQTSRDGMYEEKQPYAIYSREDVQKLIDRHYHWY